MRCLTLSLVALLAFSCKSSARKHAEAPRAEVETLAPDPQQKQNEPATEAVEKPVEEPAKKEAMETPKDQAMQSGPTAAFPFTIEMPKSRIPNPASSDDQDNSCPSFTKFTQTGDKLLITLNNMGGALPPGTPTTCGASTTAGASATVLNCKLWGRIKDVPPGYMMLADWNPASSLKYKASMRAYKPRPAGSTTVASMGDVARVSISGYTSGEGQDASRTLFYNVNLNLTKNHSYTADFSSPNLQNLAYADLGIMPNGSDGNCPTVKHDFFFAFTGFSTGITPYSNGQAALPLDGFVHSFYITELPEIAFKLVKCN